MEKHESFVFETSKLIVGEGRKGDDDNVRWENEEPLIHWKRGIQLREDDVHWWFTR